MGVDFFAGLLDHHGQIGNAEIASKRRYTYRFVLWRGCKMGIPMQMPPAHPFNPLSALRLVIAAGSDRRAVEMVFDAVFMHGRDVSDAGVIADLARELGVPDPQRALNDPKVKQRLRENT
jgi:2-hydroxychromene-2-carboxylate isomerase